MKSSAVRTTPLIQIQEANAIETRDSRVSKQVIRTCAVADGHAPHYLLGTFGNGCGTIPAPSLTAMIESIGTFVSLSTCPLGQLITRDSIFDRLPRPKWIRGSLADM